MAQYQARDAADRHHKIHKINLKTTYWFGRILHIRDQVEAQVGEDRVDGVDDGRPRLGWRDHQCQRVIDRPDLGSQLLET